MPHKSETPHNGGASRNSLAATFRDPLNAPDLRSQFLIAAYRIRPAIAATVAQLAFTGSASHG